MGKEGLVNSGRGGPVNSGMRGYTSIGGRAGVGRGRCKWIKGRE